MRRHWWRVPAVGLLAALLAYLGSYAFPTTYQSSTRLLIRGRDASVLSSTGRDLSNQPGVVDSTLAKALTETQAALVNSRTLAEQVVDDLDLDAPEDTSGVGHVLKTVVGGTINRGRAYLTHGFYKEPDRREQAIEDVQKGLAAKEVGESYVLELTGSGSTATEARAVTDKAADLLVSISRERSQLESGAHRDALQTQLDQAWEESRRAESAVADFKQEHGISDLDTELALTAGGVEQARQQLRETESELRGAQAELAATDSQLRSTPTTKSTSTEIVTGRSSTSVSATADNATYLSLLATKQRLQAQVAGLEAKRASIERSIGQAPTAQGTVSAVEAELRQLQMQSVVAADVVKSLNTDVQAAASSAASGAVELNRLDEAGLPNYPVKPTRWLFLALGLVFGGLVGFAWSFVRLRRLGYFGPGPELLDDDVVLADPTVVDVRERVEVPAAAGNGNGHHSD